MAQDTGQQQQQHDDEDKGEGCSYLVARATSVQSQGRIPKLRRVEAQRVQCNCSSTNTMLDGRLDAPAAFPRRRNRRARGGAMSLAGGAAAAAMAVAEAAQGVQAKPVAALHDLKGKGRALISRGQDSAGRARPPSGPGWLKGGQPAAGAAGLRRRTVQPAGLPAHYEYRDGEWVYSDDWSLNGRQGAPREASSVQEGSQENVAADADSDYDVDSMEDNDTPPTSLGWARTSNNVLGVDIVTDLTDSSSTTTTTRAVLTSAPTSMASTSTSTGLAAQRTNMATLTSSSATAATATASASSGSTSSSSGSGQTYDFRRDVPDGWLSDGRTAAYAVPVIVGLSIFLSCLIFSLLVIFVRATTSRRARRKQAVKLQEEGRMKKLQLPDEDGNLPPPPSGGGQDGRGSAEFDEKHHGAGTLKKKTRIGRRWTPAPNGSLRRRRRDIAKLFNRKSGDDTAATIEVVDEHPLRLTRTLTSEVDITAAPAIFSSRQEGSRAPENVSERMRDIEESRPTTRDGLLSVPMVRVGSDISSEARMTQTGEDGDEDIVETDTRRALRSASPTPSVATNSSGTTAGSNRTARPPMSIRIESPVLHLNPSSSADDDDDASDLPVIAARRSSSDSDTHAVPLPSVGPPAYIHPPSPAYSRGVALPGDSYLTHLSSTSASAPVASRYLPASAVSTPGLPSNIDEKRLLLAHQAQAEALPAGVATGTSAAAALMSSDPYREQRRYEHLYASREGEAASAEQRSGAPSSSRIDNESDVLRERLAGHIAVDDKDVLERIRGARSAPDAPPSVGSSQGSSVIPNAPIFEHDDDVDDDDFQHAISASQRAGPSTARASALPLPPRALDFASASTAFSPIDEKARLRMLEEQQAATFVDSAMQGSAPPLDMPSAPPSMLSAPPALTVPSAPAFDDEHTAPPTEVPEPSAPAFIIEDDEEEVETENGQVDQENRPFREGTI